MNFFPVLHVIGSLLFLLGGILFIPTLVAFFYTDSPFALASVELRAFLISILSTLSTGLLLHHFTAKKNTSDIGVREGFAIVTFAWVILAFFGAIPFYLSHSCTSFIDAYFETMSGFTTTGATILTDIESLPKGILFWRSMTHWLGGMGIVALSVAILPLLGAGGYQLFRAEVPGPTTDKLTPRIAETAKKLWLVYLVLTLLETALLYFGNMPLYDSICHAFGTLATGGFSTKNASIGHYDSVYFDGVITLFMFLAGCNFVLHYHLLFHGNYKTFFHSPELRLFLTLVVGCTLVITGILYFHAEDPTIYYPLSDTDHSYHSIGGALRYASFQVIGIITTTGYATANFDAWPPMAKWLLFILMFFGGCAGSTSGGIKIIRVMVVFKAMQREVYRLIHPHEIVQVKIAGNPIPQQVVFNIVGFVVLFIGLFAFFTLVISSLGVDIVTSFSAVAASLGNIGPGLAKVGAYQNYAWFSPAAKLILTGCMLLGRLEIYSVIVLLLPSLWKRY